MECLEKVIIALDTQDAQGALSVVEALGGEVVFYKVGSVLFTKEGPSFIRELKRQGKKVFLDLKYHDIPHTVKGACFQAGMLGVDLLSIHLGGGSEMIEAALAGCREAQEEGGKKAGVLGVSVLTSMDDGTLQKELGLRYSLEDQITSLVGLGLERGIDGIVSSAFENEGLRKRWGSGFLIVNPGIRLHAVENDDQKRVSTPRAAFETGASYVVIGRPVLRADDKKAVMECIRNDLRGLSSTHLV